MKDILFVCTANTCRSFLAEYLMESLVEEADLNLKVHSAGIFAVEDDEPTEEAVEILEEIYEIDGSKHRATPMTEELAEDSDYIFTMDLDLKHTLIEAYPEQENPPVEEVPSEPGPLQVGDVVFVPGYEAETTQATVSVGNGDIVSEYAIEVDARAEELESR